MYYINERYFMKYIILIYYSIYVYNSNGLISISVSSSGIHRSQFLHRHRQLPPPSHQQARSFLLKNE